MVYIKKIMNRFVFQKRYAPSTLASGNGQATNERIYEYIKAGQMNHFAGGQDTVKYLRLKAGGL
jgi:hypothetical protein